MARKSDLRNDADKKAEAAKGRDLAPHTSLRIALDALRLELRASTDLLLAALDEVTVEQHP